MNANPLRAAIASAGIFAASPALCDTIFATADPGGPFGLIGFDVFTQQSVAARFVPTAQYTLDRVSIWFMSNDFSGTVPQTVTVTLRTDTDPGGDYDSVPSGTILETWTRDVHVVGWDPRLEAFESNVHTQLHAGQRYWIVAQSSVAAGDNPVWVWASVGNEFTATNMGDNTAWQSGPGAAVGTRVVGTPVPACGSADFNHDGDSGTDLDIEAFFACIAGNCCASCDSADFNGDGDWATDADIEAFFRVLAGGAC